MQKQSSQNVEVMTWQWALMSNSRDAQTPSQSGYGIPVEICHCRHKLISKRNVLKKKKQCFYNVNTFKV